MHEQKVDQALSQIISGTFRHVVNGFLIDRQSQGLAKNTIRIYTHEHNWFGKYLDEMGVILFEEITADIIT